MFKFTVKFHLSCSFSFDSIGTELVSDELKEKIKQALVGMDRAQLTQMAFTEKQQKKISKIIAAGQMN